MAFKIIDVNIISELIQPMNLVNVQHFSTAQPAASSSGSDADAFS
jgi:hypothetical protein